MRRKVGILIVAGLALTSCSKPVALTPADRPLYVLAQDVPSLASLAVMPARGKDYELQEITVPLGATRGEIHRFYHETRQDTNGNKVRFKSAFEVFNTEERARETLHGISTAKYPLEGGPEAYGADQGVAFHSPDGLEIWLIRGRVRYIVKINGVAVPESELRTVLIDRLSAVTLRFAPTAPVRP